MNWLDITIIAIGIVFGVVGLWQGIIKMAFSIAGLIAGIYLAGRYYQLLANMLSSGGAVWAKIAAYAIILLVTLVIAGIIGWIVAKLVHITPLGCLDRMIGFILGVGIGLLLIAAGLAVLSKYFSSVEAIVASSQIARFLMARFPLLLALLPEEFDFIRDFLLSRQQIV